ncbi:hypothetical protein Poly24_31590 [Rosistilla carotiformis]|uniref:DUF3467 domain-containing protein n=1 Tax=Rosistilla carotiformis TaxID=2528017 RepID=A0A518JV67_9BACT|nr:DUF3467 domain-containing protein [Rosistilla carotiformis]QDV69443.1 hypothetical protein Poly24_31590 [Rosistilla carotiformis]
MNDSPSEDQPVPGDNAHNLRARIPDHVGEGVFSTGAIVVTGPSEFVLDFVQNISRPHRVAARVVLPHPVLPQFLEALRKNLEIYKGRFGAPADPPKPPSDARRPSPQEIYDDLKMSDSLLSGAYANGVMIGHGAAEFSMDFITSFFPQSAVSARVYMAAGQIPRLIESLDNAMKQLQIRGNQAGGQLPPPQPPKPQPPSTQSPGDDLLPPNDNRPDPDDVE